MCQVVLKGSKKDSHKIEGNRFLYKRALVITRAIEKSRDIQDFEKYTEGKK